MATPYNRLHQFYQYQERLFISGNTMELLKPVGALLLVYQQSVHYNGSIGLGFNFLLQKLCRQCYEG